MANVSEAATTSKALSTGQLLGLAVASAQPPPRLASGSTLEVHVRSPMPPPSQPPIVEPASGSMQLPQHQQQRQQELQPTAVTDTQEELQQLAAVTHKEESEEWTDQAMEEWSQLVAAETRHFLTGTRAN